MAESRLVWLPLVPVSRSLLLLDLVWEGTLVGGPDTLPDDELAVLSIKLGAVFAEAPSGLPSAGMLLLHVAPFLSLE